MNITAIIQARMGSTRLPGKVLKKLADHTVLGHVITRCQAIPSVNQVIVATTVQEDDIDICKEALKYGVPIYRGNEDNVLSRYYEAAKEADSDIIVRITSDCPLLDPEISETVIQYFLNHNYDYISSGLDGTFPRGLDTEVFTFKALEVAYKQATQEYEFEHVTPYLYQNKEQFNIHAFQNHTDQSKYRLTLDTEEDWKLISKIYDELYKGEIFYINDILELFKRYPELACINAEVKQKKLGD
ncbi:glycosyltransferase family protein [Paenibacillus sp. FSL H7-0714]|uniref:glycosyltransferase family protein n=1 Tax=Paenibacillus sp. FSL H7-0714 TaxID=2954735 RepID=UPI0030FCC619